ncbi:VpaChn25_0724 family phage protein, partial [Profundibacterium mesophilum]
MIEATMSEHRRLAIPSSGYTSNASILGDVVRGVGVASSEDQMRAALAWLKEADLIELSDLGHVVIATATPRGAEVALGEVIHPGV